MKMAYDLGKATGRRNETISLSIQCACGAGVCLNSKSGASSALRISSDVPPARTTPISPSCLRGDGVDEPRRDARNRHRNHPLHCEMDTSRIDGVKAPQHRGTPRSDMAMKFFV